jgi:hypothetical protein
MVQRGLPLAILVMAGLYLTQALQLPRGTMARPGAGWYPSMVAVFACIVALGATVHAFRSPLAVREAPVDDPDASARRRRVGAMVLSLVAFCFVLPWIGYPLAALGFVTAALMGLGSRWPTAVGTAVLSAAVSYYLFASLLDVPLPRGPW